ncbi:TPA: hypothetical protein P0E33_002787 [Vibrio harveyi]|nr:hypothetical protein [Vibrio harveyi]HDM8180612.1 hypothetical protein [Vibrio harveyi]
MTDKHTQLADALAKAIQIDTASNIRKEVEGIVLEKCMNRGFISKQDEASSSVKYLWVKKVIRNDYEALSLRRKSPLKVKGILDLELYYDDLDDMAEEIIELMSTRLLQILIPLT